MLANEHGRVLTSGAGVAGCRGRAAQAEHRRPHRRPKPAGPAPGRGVRPAAPTPGRQRVRPLQGRTLSQLHAGGRVPHSGQWTGLRLTLLFEEFLTMSLDFPFSKSYEGQCPRSFCV